jgi:hypothetical protein
MFFFIDPPSGPDSYAHTHLPTQRKPDGIPRTPEETRCWYCASVVQGIEAGAPALHHWCSAQGVNEAFCRWTVQEVGMKWNRFMTNIRDPSDYRYRVYDFKFHMQAICEVQCKGVKAPGATGH